MATLVQFLASGVNGAESGTATFLLRGTVSSAAAFLYSDFEQTAQPGTNVIVLDANGAAEVYTSAYVDCVIRNSAGTTLRTVTLGNSAPVVEVESTSFTGTDYDGAPANTIGEPITLKAILDKWILSAGAPDWQILVDGVATDLDSAIASFGTTTFVNVKSPAYGAMGDGVTDDTTAIQNALAAADGTIVFFPAGTYIVSSSISLLDANFHLMGCGHGASIIQATHTGDEVFSVGDSTAGSSKAFTGLGIVGSTTQSLELNLAPSVTVRDCSFERPITRSSSAGEVVLLIEGCFFQVGGSRNAIRNNADAGQSSITVTGCTFELEAGYTGTVVTGSDYVITGCVFDGSAVVSGTYHHINASESGAFTYIGAFVGNTFYDGGSSGYVFDLRLAATNSDFHESDNQFPGFTDPTLAISEGRIYRFTFSGSLDESSRFHFGSRLGKSLRYLQSAASTTQIGCVGVAETVVIRHTFSGAANILLDTGAGLIQMPANTELGIAVFNDSGGTQNISFNDSNATVTLSSVPDGAMAYGRYKYFLESPGIMRCICFASAQTAT